MERNRVLPTLRVETRCPYGWGDDSTQLDAKNSVSTEVEHQNRPCGDSLGHIDTQGVGGGVM